MARPRKTEEEATTPVEAEAKPEVEAPAEAEPEAKPKRAAKPKAAARPKAAAKPKAKAGRKEIVRLPKPERVRGSRKERRGVVVSAATDKTIVVRVDSAKPHPRYKKVVRRSARLHAHDEGNVAKAGDVVRIVETRPLSKLKHWRLAEVLEVAK